MATPTRRPKKRPKASPARGGFKKKGTTMARPSKSGRLPLDRTAPAAPPRPEGRDAGAKRRATGKKRTVPKSTDISAFESIAALEEQAEVL